MENYYYNHLNKAGQAAYHAIKTGLTNLAPSFYVPLLDGKSLADIYFMVRLDHPELFYSVKYSYRYYQNSENAEMIPEYLFEKKKILENQKALHSRVEKLVRPAMKLSEMDKLLYIHDFICQNVHYDKLKKAYSHEIIGSLGQGVAVCEGIAKGVKILCDALNIWCVIGISEANPDKKIKYRHAWNIVKVNGKYYHLDATFDNTLGKKEQIRYDYFLLSDKQIFRDHEPLIWKMPECQDGDHFYYKEKKLSFTKMEDVQKRAAQAVKKGKTLIFHWRGGYLTRSVLLEMLQIIEEEAKKKDKYSRVSINWPQAVLQLAFDAELPAQQMIMQEANEGELEDGAENTGKITDIPDGEEICQEQNGPY